MNFLNVVLISPKYPRNVGLVARAMENFAVQRLILVAPQCEIDLEAHQGAAQGQGPLDNHTLYSSWDEFFSKEPEGLRLGFSRRQGRRRPNQALNTLLKEDFLDGSRPTYLMFGAEDHGLSQEDCDLLHQLVHLELPGSLQSMNLSHAVVAALQTIHSALDNNLSLTSSENIESIQDPEPFLREWLEALNFDLKTHTRWNALVMLKQLLLRGAPTGDELRKLKMIVQQTTHKLRDHKRI